MVYCDIVLLPRCRCRWSGTLPLFQCQKTAKCTCSSFQPTTSAAFFLGALAAAGWVPLREMRLNVNSRDYTAQWSEEGRIFYSLLSRLTRPAKERSALSSREGGRLLLEKWPRDRRPGSVSQCETYRLSSASLHTSFLPSLLTSFCCVMCVFASWVGQVGLKQFAAG